MTIVPKAFGQPKVSPEALLESLFQPMGTDGVYGRTGRYESIVEALAALISKHREPQAEVFRFPPAGRGCRISSNSTDTYRQYLR